MQDFTFIGDALAFDFVNTEVVVRRKAIDLLQTPNDLADWWTVARSHYHLQLQSMSSLSEQQLATAKHLRSTMRRLFDNLVVQRDIERQDLATINEVLHDGYSQLAIDERGKLVINQHTHNEDAMLLTIVQSAVWLVTECDSERLRKCKNEHCVLMFLDTTKNANRVWCSTECMNRARSSAHYKQQKGS